VRALRRRARPAIQRRADPFQGIGVLCNRFSGEERQERIGEGGLVNGRLDEDGTGDAGRAENGNRESRHRQDRSDEDGNDEDGNDEEGVRGVSPAQLVAPVGTAVFAACLLVFACAGVAAVRAILIAVRLGRRIQTIVPDELRARLERAPRDVERLEAALAMLAALSERAGNAFFLLRRSLESIVRQTAIVVRAARALARIIQPS